MSRRKRDRGDGSGDAYAGTWMNTYADMVTLLLTFFAVLLSMSSVNEEKLNAFIRSFSGLTPEAVEALAASNAGGAGAGDVIDTTDIEQLYENLNSYVEETDQGKAVEVYKIDNIIYIRFSSAVFFEPDKYFLRAEGEEVLLGIGKALKLFDAGIRTVNICGHTADPYKAEAFGHWMLSGERAAVVATFLEDRVDFNSNKMTVQGFGKNYPVADNATTEGAKRNRRVELIIVGNESDVEVDVSNILEMFYDNPEMQGDQVIVSTE